MAVPSCHSITLLPYIPLFSPLFSLAYYTLRKQIKVARNGIPFFPDADLVAELCSSVANADLFPKKKKPALSLSLLLACLLLLLLHMPVAHTTVIAWHYRVTTEFRAPRPNHNSILSTSLLAMPNLPPSLPSFLPFLFVRGEKKRIRRAP